MNQNFYCRESQGICYCNFQLSFYCSFYSHIIGHYSPSIGIATQLLTHTVMLSMTSSNNLWQFYLLSKLSAKRKSPKKYFSYFVLISNLGLEPWLGSHVQEAHTLPIYQITATTQFHSVWLFFSAQLYFQLLKNFRA